MPDDGLYYIDCGSLYCCRNDLVLLLVNLSNIRLMGKNIANAWIIEERTNEQLLFEYQDSYLVIHIQKKQGCRKFDIMIACVKAILKYFKP